MGGINLGNFDNLVKILVQDEKNKAVRKNRTAFFLFV